MNAQPNTMATTERRPEKETKRKAAWFNHSVQFHLIAKYLSGFLASIFYAKFSVVFVACFSNRSFIHVHMVCETQYQVSVLSWVVCSQLLIARLWLDVFNCNPFCFDSPKFKIKLFRNKFLILVQLKIANSPIILKDLG